MKLYLTIIRSLVLFLGVNFCTAATTWTNFKDFNTNPDRNGVSLSLTGGTIDENGHIILNNGNAQFNFSGSSQRPDLSGSAKFSIAITYGAGSIQSIAPLFSSAWGTGAYAGLFGCSYNPTSQEANAAYWGSAQTTQQFPSSFPGLDPTKSLTVVFSKGDGDKVTYSFYSDTDLIGFIESTGVLSFGNKKLETLTVGGKGTSNPGSVTNDYSTGSTMNILGISYKTDGTFSEEEMNAYLKQALPVPEPGVSMLALAGLVFCAFRRKKA